MPVSGETRVWIEIVFTVAWTRLFFCFFYFALWRPHTLKNDIRTIPPHFACISELSSSVRQRPIRNFQNVGLCATKGPYVNTQWHGWLISVYLSLQDIVTCRCDLQDGLRIGWLDLLHIHNSRLQVIQRYRWCPRFTVHRYTRTRILSLH
jgi:hypothetical protein